MRSPSAPAAYIEFRVGDDEDEFGNTLGIMANPHYLEIQAHRNPS